MSRLVRGIWDSWFGRSQWRDERPSRSLHVPGWLAAAALLGAFAGGFVVGGRVGPKAVEAGAGLQANKAVKPELIDFDGQPMTRSAFIVAAYPGTDAEAKTRARALSEWLIAQGLQKARPYLAPGRKQDKVWTVAVFYAGDTEQTATRNLLAKLPEDVPDEVFVSWRKDEAEWPKPWSIQ